jgi:hypothetical protein
MYLFLQVSTVSVRQISTVSVRQREPVTVSFSHIDKVEASRWVDKAALGNARSFGQADHYPPRLKRVYAQVSLLLQVNGRGHAGTVSAFRKKSVKVRKPRQELRASSWQYAAT